MMHAKRDYHLPGDSLRRVDIEQAYSAMWRYTSELMSKVLDTPKRGGYLTDSAWKLLCEKAFTDVHIAVTNDGSPIDDREGNLAPGGAAIAQMTPSDVTYPEPGLGVAHGTCEGSQLRLLGDIRRAGTVMGDAKAGLWSDLPGALKVGTAVEQLQVRMGLRNVLVDGVRTHFPM